MFKFIMRNEQGISIVEVLIAAGMAAMISLATLEINKNTSRSFRKAQTDQTLNEFLRFQLRGRLGPSDQCLTDMGGPATGLAVGSRVPLPSLNYTDADAIVQGEVPVEFAGEYLVQEMFLHRMDTNNCRIAFLLERTNAQKKTGAAIREVSFPLSCTFNASDELQFCSASDSAAGENDVWERVIDEFGPGNHFAMLNIGNYNAAVIGATPTADTMPFAKLTLSNLQTGPFRDGLFDGISMSSREVLRWVNDPFNPERGVALVGMEDDRCLIVSTSPGNMPIRLCEDAVRLSTSLQVTNGNAEFFGGAYFGPGTQVEHDQVNQIRYQQVHRIDHHNIDHIEYQNVSDIQYHNASIHYNAGEININNANHFRLNSTSLLFDGNNEGWVIQVREGDIQMIDGHFATNLGATAQEFYRNRSQNGAQNILTDRLYFSTIPHCGPGLVLKGYSMAPDGNLNPACAPL